MLFIFPVKDEGIFILPEKKRITLNSIRVKNNMLEINNIFLWEHLLGSLFLSGVRDVGIEVKGTGVPLP